MERGVHRTSVPDGTPKEWRGYTLRIRVLYERAAVEFWTGVAAAAEDVAAA